MKSRSSKNNPLSPRNLFLLAKLSVLSFFLVKADALTVDLTITVIFT